MDDEECPVEHFLPSEIGRLVYGYLQSKNHNQVSSELLKTDPSLEECRKVRQENRNFYTTIHGLSLHEILNQYLTMHEMITKSVKLMQGGSKKKFSSAADALKFVLNPKNRSKSDVEECAATLAMGSVQKLNSTNDRTQISSDEEVFSDICLTLDGSSKESSPDSKHIRETRRRNKTPPSDYQNGAQNVRNRQHIHDVKLNVQFRRSSRLHNQKMFHNEQLDTDRVSEEIEQSTDFTEQRLTYSKPIQESSTRKTLKVLKPRKPSSNISKDASNNVKDLINAKRMKHSTLCELNMSGQNKRDYDDLSTERDISPSNDQQLASGDSGVKQNDHSYNAPSIATSASQRLRMDPELKAVEGVTSDKENRNEQERENESDDSSKSSVVETTVVSMEVIQQTLMENSSLHEKLAEKINKVISNSPKNVNSNGSEDLDNAIQKILKETERDPIIDDIMTEIFGSDCASLDDDGEQIQDLNGVGAKNHFGEETAVSLSAVSVEHVSHSNDSHQYAPIADNIRDYIACPSDLTLTPSPTAPVVVSNTVPVQAETYRMVQPLYLNTSSYTPIVDFRTSQSGSSGMRKYVSIAPKTTIDANQNTQQVADHSVGIPKVGRGRRILTRGGRTRGGRGRATM